jgi:hypothetical protein
MFAVDNLLFKSTSAWIYVVLGISSHSSTSGFVFFFSESFDLVFSRSVYFTVSGLLQFKLRLKQIPLSISDIRAVASISLDSAGLFLYVIVYLHIMICVNVL